MSKRSQLKMITASKRKEQGKDLHVIQAKGSFEFIEGAAAEGEEEKLPAINCGCYDGTQTMRVDGYYFQ